MHLGLVLIEAVVKAGGGPCLLLATGHEPEDDRHCRCAYPPPQCVLQATRHHLHPPMSQLSSKFEAPLQPPNAPLPTTSYTAVVPTPNFELTGPGDSRHMC